MEITEDEFGPTVVRSYGWQFEVPLTIAIEGLEEYEEEYALDMLKRIRYKLQEIVMVKKEEDKDLHLLVDCDFGDIVNDFHWDEMVDVSIDPDLLKPPTKTESN